MAIEQHVAGFPSESMSPDDFSNHSNTSPPPTASANNQNISTDTGAAASSSSSAAPTNMAAPHASHGLNPRSCVLCRLRKVKCDKKRPCSNCTRQSKECVFPAPGRAPRRPRKPPDSELLVRLRRLEGVVSSLGASVDEHGNATMSSQPPNGNEREPSDPSSIHRLPEDEFQGAGQSSLDSSFGRLVIDEGRSRYVTRNFWANLSNEVEDLKAILNYSSEDEEMPVLTPSDSAPSNSPANHGFVFGFSSQAQDLSPFHPRVEHALKYWALYKEHCDPLVKLLHIPSLHEKVVAAIQNPDHSSRSMEAFLFAIYFAVTTSMAPDDCLSTFGEQRTSLLKNFRFGIEQALARANFLYSEELITLQAFIIFLMCLRRHEDARVIWSLSALVVRIAMIMGLHRDGSNFGLSIFDTEIRRRTWWAVCILDIRTSEDHGCDPTIIEDTTDTKFPLNIDDADISPSTTELPKEREGIAEMTFCLIREEVAKVFRRLNTSRGHLINNGGFTVNATLKDKENWIEETHQRLEAKYLRFCDMNKPLHWVICTVARLMLAKMWLMIYHPYHRNGEALPQETRDRLFITAIESIEYSICMQTEVRTIKWGWLFKTYHQWHALAYLLSELCVRTKGPVVARAWRAVEGSVASMADKVGDNGRKSNLWRPLGKLMAKARAAREQELAAEGRPTSASPFTSQNGEAMNVAAQSIRAGSTPNIAGSSPKGFGNSQSHPNLTNLAQVRSASADLGGGGGRMFDGSQTDFRDPSSITAMANAPVERTKGPGNLSAFPKNQLNWQDISTSAPMKSPFFANQPAITPAQWQAQMPVNDQLTQQWLMNQNLPLTGELSQPGLNPAVVSQQQHSKQQQSFFDQAALGAQGMANAGPPQHQSGMQSQQGQLNVNGPMIDFSSSDQAVTQATHDPMVSGSEEAPVQWNDWDNMVREFELNGNANQWSRQSQPVFGIGDSWI